MPHGRSYQRAHFHNRATTFWKAIQKGKGFTSQQLDAKTVHVGKDETRRLIQKPRAYKYSLTNTFTQKMFNAMNTHTYAFHKIKLVPVENKFFHGKNYSEDVWVQEYFPRPTLEMAMKYFDAQRKKWLTKDEHFLCKRFFNQHKHITRETIRDAILEWEKLTRLAHADVSEIANVAILGENKGILRLAIIGV